MKPGARRRTGSHALAHRCVTRGLPAFLCGIAVLWWIAPQPAEAAAIFPDNWIDYALQLTLPVHGDEGFQQFDSFTVSHEGIQVTGGPGSLFTTLRDGKVERATLAAEGLSWQYTHPVERERRLFEMLRGYYQEELSFQPSFAHLECDPSTCSQQLGASFRGLRAIPADQAGPALRRLWQKGLDEMDRRRRDGDEPGLGVPYEADHKRLSVAVWQAGHNRFAQLDDDSHDPREVSMRVAGWGAWSYYAAATRAAGLSTEDLERRPDAARRDYDLVSMTGTISMALEEKELLSGALRVELKAKRDLPRVVFTLAGLGDNRGILRKSKGPRLTVHSVRDAQGQTLVFVRTGPVSGYIELPGLIKAGDIFTLSIAYDSRDAIKRQLQSYSYVDRDGWLPFINLGDRIDRFDVRVSVPANTQVLCVGRSQAEPPGARGRSARCGAEAGVVFPTAVFGKYREYPSKVAATRSDGTTIPVTVYIDEDTVAASGVPRAPAAADQAAEALMLYREIFGLDYPFPRLDLVNAPQGLSGQGPDSIVYLGDTVFSGGRYASRLSVGEMTRFEDKLIPHEVAHQWWGSLVSSANQRSYWLFETLAEYASALFLQQSDGIPRYLAAVEDWRSRATEREGWLTLADNVGSYDKGPYLLHMLRSLIGDARFFEFLKSLAQQTKGREITTMDVQRVAEASSGLKLDWFFDQWVRGQGIPEFTFTHSEARNPDGTWKVEGTIDQKVMVTTRWSERKILPDVYFQGGAFVTITGRSGKEYRGKYALTGARTPFSQIIPEEPKAVNFNKYGEMLSYYTKPRS